MTDYTKLKATELKDLLRERNIPSTGLTRKQQYIEALEAQDASQAERTEGTPEQPKTSKETAGVASVTAEDAEGAGNEAVEDATLAEEPAQVVQEEQAEVVPADAAGESVPDVIEEVAPSTDAQKEVLPEDAGSPGRKRKRDSDDADADVGSASKKAKSTEPEMDAVEEDAPVSVNEPTASPAAIQVQPWPVADDVVNVAEHDSVHPPTRSLYVRDLMRPLQPQQLRDHLVLLTTPEDDEQLQDPEESEIVAFHLDNIKTHAFVTFSSVAVAMRVRSHLHGIVWPEEVSRKPLWVDFIADDRVQEWIDRETESLASKRDVKRWEVTYTRDATTNTVEATLQEITAPTGPRRQSSNALPTSQPGQGMPNAPTGPRNAFTQQRQTFNNVQRRPSFEHQRQQSIPTGPRNAIASRAPPPNRIKNPTVLSTARLTKVFPSTATKPSLFYVPCSSSLAQARLDNLAGATSRTWDDGRIMAREGTRMGFAERELRRYTFEGDRVVDGGVDFGGFGRVGGGGGRGRGGYGRGRGGW